MFHRATADRRQRFAEQNSVHSTPKVEIVLLTELLQIAKCAAVYCIQQLQTRLQQLDV